VTLTRRQFGGAVSLATFGFLIGCERKQMTPGEAHVQGAKYEVFGVAEAQVFETLADRLLPGARQAGVAHFVDHQLAAADADVLLMIRYFSVPKPFSGFYRGGLTALESASRRIHGKGFIQLQPLQQADLIHDMSRDRIVGWQGPPQSFFYLIVRNDAIDVVYGTVDGFKLLGIPYMPHISPPAFN